MNCACEQVGGNGSISNVCRAHVEWHEKASFGSCHSTQHKNYDDLVKQLEYQTQRADMFERLLIRKACF